MTPELVGERTISIRGSQDHDLRSCWNVGPYKVRVSMRIDASHFYQSRDIQAEVWKPGLGWTEVATLHWSVADRKPEEIVVAGRENPESRLLRLEAELLKQTLWILEAE